MIRILLLLFIFSMSQEAFAQVYVAINGSDKGDGSKEKTAGNGAYGLPEGKGVAKA